MECLVYIHGASSLDPRYADCTRVACGVRPRDVIRQKCKLPHVSPRFPAKKRVSPRFFPILAHKKYLFRKKPVTKIIAGKSSSLSHCFGQFPHTTKPTARFVEKKIALFSIFPKNDIKKAWRRPKSKKCHIFKVVDYEISVAEFSARIEKNWKLQKL